MIYMHYFYDHLGHICLFVTILIQYFIDCTVIHNNSINIYKKHSQHTNTVSRHTQMTSQSSQKFKQQLIHLRSDFNSYLKLHNTKGIPIQHLVILLQKYLAIQPSSLETLLARSITKQEITWENLLIYIQNELVLQDKVNKMQITRPSTIDVSFQPNPDPRLQQNLWQIISYIKKKSTNYTKFITKAQFLGFKMLVVVLERQAIFYDCESKSLVRAVNFRYSNVRRKLIDRYVQKQRHSMDTCNTSFLKINNTGSQMISPGLKSHQNINYKSGKNHQKQQQMDKVNPMSRRTDEHAHSFSYKSHKNTNQSQQLKNILGPMKASKVGSSMSVCSQTNQNYKSGNNNNNVNGGMVQRSVTMMDHNYDATNIQNKNKNNNNTNNSNSNSNSNRNNQITSNSANVGGLLGRQNTRVYKFGSLQHNAINSGKISGSNVGQNNKKDVVRIRSSDTGQILKIITDSKVQGSIQAIKAYRSSVQSFQKYVNIDKSKLQRQKQLLQQYKPPSGINIKLDYKKQLNKMKYQSRQLSMKRKPTQQPTGRHTSELNKYNKNKRSHTQTNVDNYITQQQSLPMHNTQQLNTFANLQNKVLQIQSVSFYDNYMLVSLINCELRLYSFKKTIHGFSQQLIFQKSYQSIITYVMLYRSQVRKLFNICISLSKFNTESGNTNAQTNMINNQSLIDIRHTAIGLPKIRETQIYVYQLNASMQIQKLCHQTYLTYSPLLIPVLPLGLCGYIQSGAFFLLQLNSKKCAKSQQKSLDCILCNPDTSARESISSMKCHPNFVNFYIGCKNGMLYIFDRLSLKIRNKNKVMSNQIVQIMFISQGQQILAWDVTGKLAIIDADSLIVSAVVNGGMGHVGSRTQANPSNSGYWGMIEYFYQGEFLVYGNRSIGLVSLFQNQQKKFNASKPMKILTRRQSIKNRIQPSQSRLNPTSQPYTIPSLNPSLSPSSSSPSSYKQIHSLFHTPLSLILTLSTGQILLYNQQCIYIGSYFTMQYRTITRCITCSAIKYLFMLHQNNQMQVANIYTQEEKLVLTAVKQEVYDVFFCNSELYFCGYVSAKKYVLYIYGYGDQNNKSKYSIESPRPLVTVSLFNLVLQIKGDGQVPTDRQSQFSKFSNLSMSTNSSYVDVDIVFHRGSPILIKKCPPQLTFLYKKSFTRNCTIKLLDHLSSPISSVSATTQLIQITHSALNIQSQLLTLLLTPNILVIISIEHKNIRGVYLLPHQLNNNSNNGSIVTPIQHYCQIGAKTVSVVWRIQNVGVAEQGINNNEDSYAFARYQLPDIDTQSTNNNQVMAKLLFMVKQQPSPPKIIRRKTILQTSDIQLRQSKTQNFKSKPSLNNKKPHPQSRLYSPQKSAQQPQILWKSPPILIGSNIATLSTDSSHMNLYKIMHQPKSKHVNNTKIEQNRNQKGEFRQNKKQYTVEYHRIAVDQ